MGDWYECRAASVEGIRYVGGAISEVQNGVLSATSVEIVGRATEQIRRLEKVDERRRQNWLNALMTISSAKSRSAPREVREAASMALLVAFSMDEYEEPYFRLEDASAGSSVVVLGQADGGALRWMLDECPWLYERLCEREADRYVGEKELFILSRDECQLLESNIEKGSTPAIRLLSDLLRLIRTDAARTMLIEHRV